MYHRALHARGSRRSHGRDLTDAERSEIRQAFDLFDVDRSGCIYYRELKTCLRALEFPCKKSDVLSLLRYAELDQSEPISYDDFEKLMRAQYLGRSFDELVERAFKVFDAENRGHITVKGLKRVTRDAGHEIHDDELHEMIQMFDTNGDGVIDKARMASSFHEIWKGSGQDKTHASVQTEFKRILNVYDPNRDEDESDEEHTWRR